MREKFNGSDYSAEVAKVRMSEMWELRGKGRSEMVRKEFVSKIERR